MFLQLVQKYLKSHFAFLFSFFGGFLFDFPVRPLFILMFQGPPPHFAFLLTGVSVHLLCISYQRLMMDHSNLDVKYNFCFNCFFLSFFFFFPFHFLYIYEEGSYSVHC